VTGKGPFGVPVVCSYEEREGDTVVSTGRLTLDRVPSVGDVLRLGGRRVRVEEVVPRADEVRLVLERL